MHLVPTKVCFTKGVGTRKEDKNARDEASRAAGIGKINLVTVSSILPPGIQEISLEEFKESVTPGEIVFSIHGICEANEPGTRVTAAIGLAQPWDKTKTGFVTEKFEFPGILPGIATERCEKMAIQIFADENGIYDIDVDAVWENGKTTYEIGGHKVEITSFVASSVCNTAGDYTCAAVFALFLFD
jgi:arginine decarboxylase